MMELAARQQLMEVIGHNCHCVRNAAGDIVTVCAVHEAFVTNEAFFSNHMEFARYLRERLIREERTRSKRTS